MEGRAEIATHQRSFEVAHFSLTDSHWCDKNNELDKQSIGHINLSLMEHIQFLEIYMKIDERLVVGEWYKIMHHL